MTTVSRDNAPHYSWGDGCDGWRLVDTDALSVIEERVPPGCAEIEHLHERARQFFRILEGEAVLKIDGVEHRLIAGTGIEVPPETPHKFINRSNTDVRFLVISAPSTRGDRIELEHR